MRGIGPRGLRFAPTAKAAAYLRYKLRANTPAPAGTVAPRSKYTPGQQGAAERARRLAQAAGPDTEAGR